MDNLFGKDYMNIERIYDIKGSKVGRRTKLTTEELAGNQHTGLKVLKDLNYLDFEEGLHITEKTKLHEVIESDARFL